MHDYYKTSGERREKEALIGDHTVKVRYWDRIDLRAAVRWSVRTAGHSDSKMLGLRRFLPVLKRDDHFRDAYAENPGLFGGDIARKGFGGREIAARLHELRDGKTQEPFLVVRSLFPTAGWWRHSAKFSESSFNRKKPVVSHEKWYLKESYYDLIGSALLSALGVYHRSRAHHEKSVYRDYFTAPAAEIDQFSGDEDIPRRWRQAIPEFGLIDESAAVLGGLLTARYAVYVCIENPIKDPLWVLPAHHVIDALEPDVKAYLHRSAYDFFDHWYDDLSQRGVSLMQKILGGENENLLEGQNVHYNKWMSFDANRLNAENKDTKPDERVAAGKLRQKMQQAAETHALPIVLKRGDALIVDNYRALIRRTELKYRVDNPWLWGRPPIRWIRMYCGFPGAATQGGGGRAGRAN